MAVIVQRTTLDDFVMLVAVAWLLIAVKIILWLLVVAAIVVGVSAAIAVYFAKAPPHEAGGIGIVSLFVLLLAGLTLLALPKSAGPMKANSLALATATIRGAWVEEDMFADDSSAWSGTAFVTEKRGNKLVLFTNSHCLALSELANADSASDGSAEVLKYSLVVQFPGGAERPVLRMAEERSNLDLACLEVSADGLKEGRDYVIVQYGTSAEVKIGDRVIAVGNPLGSFSGTHTFGRISALRNQGAKGEKCKVIQHDAAINPGNSGGPLFAEKDDEVYWIGINTWGVGTAQGIFLSIAADEARNAQYVWAQANPAGAVELIKSCLKGSATVAPRDR